MRSLSCALEGPIRLAKGPAELMKKVEEGYAIWFRLFNTSLIPKLMKINKWYDDSKELEEDDIVYFKKDSSELSSRYTVGKVTEAVKSSDGLVRRAKVEYHNSNEKEPRVTDRGARSLIRLFNIDDTVWRQDMVEVDRMIQELDRMKNEEDKVVVDKVKVAGKKKLKMKKVSNDDGLKYKISDANSSIIGEKLDAFIAKKRKCKFLCCCTSHCEVAAGHSKNDVYPNIISFSGDKQEVFPGLLDKSWCTMQNFEEQCVKSSQRMDGLSSMLCSINTDFGNPSDDDELVKPSEPLQF